MSKNFKIIEELNILINNYERYSNERNKELSMMQVNHFEEVLLDLNKMKQNILEIIKKESNE